jgi:hypothetical protein
MQIKAIKEEVEEEEEENSESVPTIIWYNSVKFSRYTGHVYTHLSISPRIMASIPSADTAPTIHVLTRV